MQRAPRLSVALAAIVGTVKGVRKTIQSRKMALVAGMADAGGSA